MRGLTKKSAISFWLSIANEVGDLVCRPGFEKFLPEGAFGYLDRDTPLGLQKTDLQSLTFFSPKNCRLLSLRLLLNRNKRLLQKAGMPDISTLLRQVSSPLIAVDFSQSMSSTGRILTPQMLLWIHRTSRHRKCIGLPRQCATAIRSQDAEFRACPPWMPTFYDPCWSLSTGCQVPL